jgi:NADH-quinone oxidoreductase subunit M
LELLLIPLLFAVLVAIAPKNLSKWIGLLGSLATLITVVIRSLAFIPTEKVDILHPDFTTSFKMTLNMGYDGMGLLMVMLTAVVVPLILLTSINRSEGGQRGFNAMVLLMEFGLIGVFTALDGLLFYVFWELTLIPIFLIALWYGTEDRKPVLIKFFIYTFVGSLAMLISLIALGNLSRDFSYESLLEVTLPIKTAFWVMGGFFLAFAIKIPLFPFHTWQPSTYTVAPSAGTMLLSALMLKMALYGMIRWMIPMAPEALEDYKYIIITLGLIGVVYGAIIAIKQMDIKRLIAFSSISHVGLIAAGIVLFTEQSLSASYIQMVNHALVAVGLFLAAGILEDRLKTRDLSEMGGVAVLAPKFAFWFAVISFAAVSVPFTSGFIGEFLLLKGLFYEHWLIGTIAGTTLVFGAVYTLRAYQLSMFGAPKIESFEDLKWNEVVVFAVITILIVLIGIFPQFISDLIEPSLDTIYNYIHSVTFQAA